MNGMQATYRVEYTSIDFNQELTVKQRNYYCSSNQLSAVSVQYSVNRSLAFELRESEKGVGLFVF